MSQVNEKPAPTVREFDWKTYLALASGFLDRYFKISERGSTVNAELFCGVVHYMSCFYILSVIPSQLEKAGYSKTTVFVVTSLTTGIGSIACGLISNLPIIIAPPTSVSIFFADFLQLNTVSGISTSNVGNLSNIIAGFCLIVMVLRPVNDFVSKSVPLPIQVGTTVGIGLITSLAGATDLNLIVQGEATLLSVGDITPTSSQFFIAYAGLFIIAIGLHYHWKSTFMISFTFCALLFWLVNDNWPGTIANGNPTVNSYVAPRKIKEGSAISKLSIDLVFLSILYLNGLLQSQAALATLENEDGTVPGGNWVYLICGASTILSGIFCGAPVLVSPESAAGIKAGARTGLSAIVGGVLFLLSTIFAPLFALIPACATSPILIVIGAVLFQNVLKLEWYVIKDAIPAFLVLFFIPMTFDILDGLIIGYIMYFMMAIFTGTAGQDLSLFFGFDSPVDDDNNPNAGRVSSASGSIALSDRLGERRPARIVMNMGYPEMLMDNRIRRRRFAPRPLARDDLDLGGTPRYPSQGLFSDPGGSRFSLDAAKSDAASVRMSFPSTRSSSHSFARSWSNIPESTHSQSILPRVSSQSRFKGGNGGGAQLTSLHHFQDDSGFGSRAFDSVRPSRETDGGSQHRGVDGVAEGWSPRNSSFLTEGTGNGKTFSGKGGKQTPIREHSIEDEDGDGFGVSGRGNSNNGELLPHPEESKSGHPPVDNPAQAHHTASPVAGAITSTESAISNPLTEAVQSESRTAKLD